jgi:hypothetical protein
MKLPGLIRLGQIQLQAAQYTCAAFSLVRVTVWYPLDMIQFLPALHHGRFTFRDPRSSFYA